MSNLIENRLGLYLLIHFLDFQYQNCFFFFESYLEDSLQNLVGPTVELARHVVLSGGKRIRPLLCFHCGAQNPNVTNDLLKASTILELVHVATLVHDDMIDQALLRRNSKTIHSFAGDNNFGICTNTIFY